MKRLAILGASGHGKVVADTALSLGYGNIVFFDDAWPDKRLIGNWNVEGSTKELLQSLSDFDAVMVGIGENRVRLEKHDVLLSAGAPVVNIIHPVATVSALASVGLGSVLFAGAVVNIDSVLGAAVIVNTGATVDHDCVLHDGVHIAPGAHLSGNVHVGLRSWIGVGACVKQGVHIGADVMVGAGTVVVSDIPDAVTAVGNPARRIKSSAKN
jgi:sugar O-acyltransferase (sialic acid O-acetyltransferase NeuD family)